MLRVFLALTAIFLNSSLIGAQESSSPAEKSPTQIFKETSPAIVFITTQTHNGQAGPGSGFIVSPDGMIMTAYHVVAGAVEINVRLKDGTVHAVSGVVDYDKIKDICVFKIDADNLPALSLGDSSHYEEGQKIYLIGNPLGLEYTISDGLLSGRRALGMMTVIQFSAPVSPGSSGGPLINPFGEAMGITSSGILSGQPLNFAIPINAAKQYLKNYVTQTMEEFKNQVTPGDEFYYAGKESLGQGYVYEARGYFEQATAVNPRFAEAYLELSLIYMNSNHLDEINKAIEYAQEAYYRNSKNEFMPLVLGLYYAKRYYLTHQTADAQKALELYQSALEINSHLESAYVEKGRIHISLKEMAQAEYCFKEAIKINAISADAYGGLGDVEYSQGRHDEAIRQYQYAIKLNPNLEYLRASVATIAMEIGDRVLAFSEINKIKDPYSSQQLRNEYENTFGQMSFPEGTAYQQTPFPVATAQSAAQPVFNEGTYHFTFGWGVGFS